jgi:hypothetical protein
MGHALVCERHRPQRWKLYWWPELKMVFRAWEPDRLPRENYHVTIDHDSGWVGML